MLTYFLNTKANINKNNNFFSLNQNLVISVKFDFKFNEYNQN